MLSRAGSQGRVEKLASELVEDYVILYRGLEHPWILISFGWGSGGGVPESIQDQIPEGFLNHLTNAYT